jgi:hypothetical protein
MMSPASGHPCAINEIVAIEVVRAKAYPAMTAGVVSKSTKKTLSESQNGSLDFSVPAPAKIRPAASRIGNCLVFKPARRTDALLTNYLSC